MLSENLSYLVERLENHPDVSCVSVTKLITIADSYEPDTFLLYIKLKGTGLGYSYCVTTYELDETSLDKLSEYIILKMRQEMDIWKSRATIRACGG